MAVFVLDKHKRPLMPCSEKRARLLLKRSRAVVHRRYPFTIRLKDRIGGAVQPIRNVLHLAEIVHRGHAIHKKMQQRAAFRRRRRSAHLRYRKKRFENRTRPEGWLPPSLQSRVDNSAGWVDRYRRLAPVSAISVEHVRFDMQKMQNPEIGGMEYQHGELVGYELREYLLEKWGRTCAYCGAENVPLQIEHINAQTHGGSNRASNLTLAGCHCNQRKGALPVEVFLKDRPDVLKRILAHVRMPLDAAAAVNATRGALVDRMRQTGLPLERSSGGRTKWNRHRFDVPKEHGLDAACVGNVEALSDWDRPVCAIGCTGRGSYQRTRLTAHGFPRGSLMRQKTVHGFQTGDMVRAVLTTGKKAGVHIGKVAVRATGSFSIQTPLGVVQGIWLKHCTLLSRADGHSYHTERRTRLLPMAQARGLRREEV